MSRARKNTIRIALLGLLGLLGAVAWWWQRVPGMNPLERWCASELRRVAGDLLAPTFSFGDLQLELPATITLTNVTLTSEGDAIVQFASMRLELRDRPKRGHPLTIAAATFDEPQVHLIGQPDGTLQGFDTFVKSTTGQQYDDGGSSKPSDILAIRKITIRDGLLEWDPAGAEAPMVLDKLNMDLSAQPEPDKPGWYGFKAAIARAPVIQLDWDGGISIDTGDLAFDDTTLEVDLSEDKYASLPPSIQHVLRQYAIVGQLTLKTTGHIPLNDTEQTDLLFDAKLRDASAGFDAYQFPIDSAEMNASFKQMRFAWNPLNVKAFGGTINTTGRLGFDDAAELAFNANAKNVEIQDVLRPEPGKPPRFAGTVTTNLDATRAAHAPDSLTGTGTLDVVDGQLINIPIVGALADVLMLHNSQHRTNDKGAVEFTLSSDRVTVTKSQITSRSVGAHGTGDIRFDGGLDFKVNAGVIEAAEAHLGELGDILAALTDRMLPFLVTGTWEKPKVTPAPLGVPLGGN